MRFIRDKCASRDYRGRITSYYAPHGAAVRAVSKGNGALVQKIAMGIVNGKYKHL